MTEYKKSLEEARERARECSLAFGVKVYVLNKKGKKRAICTTSQQLVEEFMENDWEINTLYENGIEK